MAAEWREKTLSQLGRIVTGKTPPSGREEFFGGSIPFITPTDFDGRRTIDRTERYLTSKGVDAVSGSVIPARSVLVSCIGSDMGRAAVASVDGVTNQQINSIVVETDDDPLFVYYSLSNRRSEIRIAASGSAQPILNKSAFGRLKIRLPPPVEQRAIARVLAALDDKIELNRRMNETLEAMARAIFTDWFVDFGPDTNDEIPAGWRSARIGDILELVYGKALPERDRQPGSVPVYGSGGIAGFHSTSIAEGPSIIVGRKGTVGSLHWEDRNFYPIDTVFYVRAKAPLTYCFYLLERLRLDTMNTDAAVPGLNRNNVYRLETLVPPNSLLAEFDALVSSIRQRMRAAADESDTLAEMRDALLPKLISGQIRVRDAEKLEETAQ